MIELFLAAITPAQQPYAVPVPAFAWSCQMLRPSGKLWKIAGSFDAISKYNDYPYAGNIATSKAKINTGLSHQFGGAYPALFNGAAGVFNFSTGDGLNGYDFEFDASQKTGLASLKISARSPNVIEPFAVGYCEYSGQRIARYQR